MSLCLGWKTLAGAFAHFPVSTHFGEMIVTQFRRALIIDDTMFNDTLFLPEAGKYRLVPLLISL